MRQNGPIYSYLLLLLFSAAESKSIYCRIHMLLRVRTKRIELCWTNDKLIIGLHGKLIRTIYIYSIESTVTFQKVCHQVSKMSLWMWIFQPFKWTFDLVLSITNIFLFSQGHCVKKAFAISFNWLLQLNLMNTI